MSSYFGDLYGRPQTDGMTIFLAFLVFVLALTLGLVWSDFVYGWGILRKRYPNESCVVKEDGTHTCLDGLQCINNLCTC